MWLWLLILATPVILIAGLRRVREGEVARAVRAPDGPAAGQILGWQHGWSDVQPQSGDLA